MKNGLTISMIFEAQSANYGEGFGNIATLKKLSRSDGKTYTYISRQALRYNMINQLGWDNTPVFDNGVVQFAPNATIRDYPEIDLFGYMKTEAKGSGAGTQTRSAVARLSNAISLEPYNSDMDFLNNMGMARRQGLNNAIAQSEIHHSLYAYTITVDLDRIGEDGDISLDSAEKEKRVENLLDTIQFLYRDIKGRRENLNPIFVIGGVYDRKNPYFEDRLKIDRDGLQVKMIEDIRNSCDDTLNNTVIGYVPQSLFNNEQIMDELHPLTVPEAFQAIKKEVKTYYESDQN